MDLGLCVWAAVLFFSDRYLFFFLFLSIIFLFGCTWRQIEVETRADGEALVSVHQHGQQVLSPTTAWGASSKCRFLGSPPTQSLQACGDGSRGISILNKLPNNSEVPVSLRT